MKNLSLSLNAVLAVAVAVLFYLHFSKSHAATSSEGPLLKGTLSIAYINSDSVLKNYEYSKVTRDKLEAKGKKLDQDLTNRAQAFQNDYEAYQRNIGSLTIGQAKALEEDLQKKQQNLQLYQQTLAQEMGAEQDKVNLELYNRITSFLKKYGEEKGLHIVFKFNSASDVLYGANALDITSDVVARLNEDYKTEKANPPAAKKDTTSKK